MVLLGTTPLIMNCMSEKTRQGLLLPKGRKTAADKAAKLKHDPLSEYRGSMYRARDSKDTLLAMPASCFKKAMAAAALDLEGMKKSEVGRLSWCEGVEVDIFGVPELFMSVVRSADINKTPDIRTRAILPRWACIVTMSFIQPKMNATLISKLMGAAGLIVGVGDWRQQKGSGNYGQFDLVEATNEEFLDITKQGGRKAQTAAFNTPETYDDESAKLYAWWHEEAARRGKLPANETRAEAIQ